MQNENKTFRFESLEDGQSIAELLKSIANALSKGQLEFSDSKQQIEMTPTGLLNFKVVASQEEGRNQLNLKVTWQDESRIKTSKKKLKVKTN